MNIMDQCSDYIQKFGIENFAACEMKKNSIGRDLAYNLPRLKLSAEKVVTKMNRRDEWLEAGRRKLAIKWKEIVDTNGIKALSLEWAHANGYEFLRNEHLTYSISIKEISNRIGMEKEYAVRWRKYTKESYDKIVRDTIKKYRCLPSCEVLHADGLSLISHHLKEFYKDYNDLKKAFGVDNIKLQAINGCYLRSISEVSFVNYLLAHGIDPTPGGLYPESFQLKYGKKCQYDPGFRDRDGNEIKCEIFGGGPCNKEEYARVRKMKEDFHAGDPYFLAIEFGDCYNDAKLGDILEKFIGRPDRVIIDDRFPEMPATMLSVIDDTLKRCQEICDRMPDGELPSHHWFHRTNTHKNRIREAWEPNTWSGLVESISKLGWVNVRKEMKKTLAQRDYIKQRVLDECRVVFDRFKMGPNYVSNLTMFDGRHLKSCSKEDRQWREKARCASNHFRKICGGGDDMIIEMLGVKDIALAKRKPWDVIKKVSTTQSAESGQTS